ncbi:hypothetical protein CMT75_17745 [Elizabethkingia anophelis]|nr:hypothetical protein [Elizabethkingia anophelis]
MSLLKLENEFILQIKDRIKKSQYQALKAVNNQLIKLYWDIGMAISAKQREGWGKSIVENLSSELQKEFPGTGGFSTTNLWYMAKFYSEYCDNPNLQPMVGEISWTKHIAILSKCKNQQERQFYIQATKRFDWTKNILINQIENKTFERYLLNQTNWEDTLSTQAKENAMLAVKDHYTFDFLNMSEQHSESDLEQALIGNVRSFLLEMGPDFSYLGNQYKLEINQKEYYIDLLLFHRKLQSLVAIEIKIGEFLPEYKGKMEFYLSVLNDKVKLEHENEALGIIICKSKDRTIVEYSLKTSTLPIGVATYSTTKALPNQYKDLLPSAREIEKKLDVFFKNKET